MRVLLLLFALVNVPAVLCWGPIGHQVTASVAQALLNTAANNGVNNVLAGDTLESVATWADQVKHTSGYEWSGVLHYINTPDWACNYSPTRDCSDKMCVAGAIYNYTQRLASSSISSTQRTEALKFLTHFAGDIHQPLHVGFTSDEGGNSIKGSYDGNSDNLHNIWDTDMIQTHLNNDFNGDQNQYVQYLVSNIQGSWSGNATIWASCGASPSPYACPDSWASESVVLACTHAYVDQTGAHIQSGFSLGDPYYQFNVGVIDMQLAKGGVRLASSLNKIFASDADSSLDSNLDMFDDAIMAAFGLALPSN